MAFNLSEGKETIITLTESVTTAANDAVQILLQKDFAEVLAAYPWQFLQKFLVDFGNAIDQNLSAELIQYLDEFFSGQGSFVDFAEQLDNSETAIDLAREVQTTIMNIVQDNLSNYRGYIDPLANQLVSIQDAKFDDNLQDELNRAAEAFVNNLENDLYARKAQITEASEENNFVYPMDSVAEIVFGRTIAYGNALLQEIPGFISEAQTMLQRASSAAMSATENAAAAAKNAANL